MSETKPGGPRSSASVIVAFMIGEWLMLSTGAILFLWSVLSSVGVLAATPQSNLFSLAPWVALSFAFAWNFRWLRGSTPSLFGVLPWILVAWSVIVVEALGINLLAL